MLQNSPSWATLLTFFLSNSLYLVFQKGKKQARRQVFLKWSKFFETLFFLQDIVRSNYRKTGWNSYSTVVIKNLKNTFWGYLCSNTSIETNQKVTVLKKPQEELINWYLLFVTPIHHRKVISMSYVIQSCNIKAIGYKAKSMPKIEFLLCRVTFHGNISWKSCKKSSFSYGKLNQMYVTESNFIHSSFHFVKSVFLKWICICVCLCIKVFTMDQ